MDHITIGRHYNQGKIAYVQCIKNDDLADVDIKNKCFLLLVLTEGSITFTVNNKQQHASAPCFICFNEKSEVDITDKKKLKCFSIYFHPMFLNINMTFDLIRSDYYGDIAHNHDMFLLKPFLDDHYIIPICENYIDRIESACDGMEKELREQRDWYWSCRGRSYFMEVIIALERMFGIMGYGEIHSTVDSTPSIINPGLKEAIMYIEGHYSDDMSLSDISLASGLNHTTLTRLLKEETGLTAMEYLMNYRIGVAKKQLSFTDVPIKDIALRCGFKTVQHFSRVFKLHTSKTPAEYRKSSVNKRKEDIHK